MIHAIFLRNLRWRQQKHWQLEGFKPMYLNKLTPTPELSFAVRYLQAFSGIVVTASHNPPEYNGYKVYGSDGGQLPPKEQM